MFRKLDTCLCCGGKNLVQVLDLNEQPLANSYLPSPYEDEKSFPLAINFCNDCTHIQLTHAVDPNLLFKNYLYVSGTTRTLRDYFEWFVDFTSKFGDGRKVLDIACNDGTQLDSYKAKGFETYGIDPAENLYEISSSNHKVICDYFTEKSAKQLGTKFDVITAQNVFAHNTYPLEFLETCKTILSDNGHIFIQTSQADMVINNQFDTIYHEHISFFSVKSFCTLAKRAGLNVVDITRTDVHGTSFVFVLSKSGVDKSKEFIDSEPVLSLDQMKHYAQKCKDIASEVFFVVANLKQMGYKVVGYGAAAKGNTFLNFSRFVLDYIVDDNELKQDLYTPGSRIRIVSPDELESEYEKLCVIPLAWNFFDEIKSKVLSRNPKVTCFVKYFPQVEIVNV